MAGIQIFRTNVALGAERAVELSKIAGAMSNMLPASKRRWNSVFRLSDFTTEEVAPFTDPKFGVRGVWLARSSSSAFGDVVRLESVSPGDPKNRTIASTRDLPAEATLQRISIDGQVVDDTQLGLLDDSVYVQGRDRLAGMLIAIATANNIDPASVGLVPSPATT